MTTELKPCPLTGGLKPCPCGHIPEGLRIEGEVKAKFARVCGECCGEWSVEFRNDYYPLDSEQSLDRAAKAWNSVPRPAPRVEREPSDEQLLEIVRLALPHLPDMCADVELGRAMFQAVREVMGGEVGR